MPRFSCALNGVTPDAVDPSLRVTDITELPPRCRVTYIPTERHGLRLLQRVRESLTVRVSFFIPEYDPVRRRELVAKLHAWADAGGALTTSDRPGQQLHVTCDTLPLLSALCWSDDLIIEFTACADPYWEYAAETSASTASSSLLTLPGDGPDCPVAVTVTNTGSEPLTTLTLTCGQTQMTFERLTLAPGGVFSLRTEDGLLRADADGESVLMHRTAASSDLLLADCGTETPVTATADQPVQAVFHGRGRLL